MEVFHFQVSIRPGQYLNPDLPHKYALYSSVEAVLIQREPKVPYNSNYFNWKFQLSPFFKNKHFNDEYTTHFNVILTLEFGQGVE